MLHYHCVAVIVVRVAGEGEREREEEGARLLKFLNQTVGVIKTTCCGAC